MDRILIGLVVGAAFASTIAIFNSKSFLLWQKIILGILVIFVPAQWVLAIVFFLGNNYSDNNPEIKNKALKFFNNFLPKEMNDKMRKDKNHNGEISEKGFQGSNPYSK